MTPTLQHDIHSSGHSGSRSHHPWVGALLDTPGRRLFASRDLDEARMLVGRVMKPHQLQVEGRAQRLDARMHHAAFGRVSLSRLAYGADVAICPGPLDDFYLVQMPLAGCARIESSTQAVDSTPDVASVLSPTTAVQMRWSADSDQLLLRIDRALVDHALAARLGRPAAQPLEFQLGFRWRDNAAWRCLLGYLLDCTAQGVDVAAQPLLAAHVQHLVAATLLSAHAHNHSHSHSDGPATRVAAVLPRHVRKVQDYLQSHADEPVSPDDLARMAGVSLRSLYAGFKAHGGCSPMQYLRDIRLDRVRADLLEGAGNDSTVAGIALRWGFGHLGRFSADYRVRFGESPSQTRQRG